MKNKGFFVFLFAFLAVLGWGYYEYQKTQETKSAEAKKGKLLQFAISSIDGFEKSSPSETYSVKRDQDGQWVIDGQLKDWADSDMVKNYFRDFEGQKADVVVENPEDMGVFGFGEADTIYRFYSDGKTLEIHQSSKSTFDGRVYLRVSGESRVYLGEASWARFAGKGYSDLRSKSLFPSRGIAVSELRWKRPKEKLSLEKVDQGWQVSGRPEILLDGSRVQGFLSQIESLKADVVTDIKVDGANLKAFGLIGSKVQEYEALGQDVRRHLKVGTKQDDGYLYLVSSERDYLLKLKPESLEKVALRLDDVRDRKYAFQYDRDSVKKVLVDGESFVAEDQGWVRASDKKAADEDRLSDLLQKIEGLEVDSFGLRGLGANKKTDFSRKIRLEDQAGQPVFELQWTSEVLKRGAQEGYLVKTLKEPKAFFVAKNRLQNLPTEFTIDETTDEETTEQKDDSE